MHHGVISLLGHDTVEDVLYGVSTNGKAVLKSTTDHAAKFITVSISEWDTAKAKGSTNRAVMIGGDLVLNTTKITPLPEHTITSTSGTKWGGITKRFLSSKQNKTRTLALLLSSVNVTLTLVSVFRS